MEDRIVWDGEGLPPIGCVCEMYEVTEDGAWEVVKIIGRHDHFTWALRSGSSFPFSVAGECECRPVRTPEQIAAEERERAINDMAALSPLLDKGWSKLVCAAIYDAGYRKPE